MKRRIILSSTLLLLAGFTAAYMFNLKTEKAVSGNADFQFTSAALLKTYSTNPSQSDSLLLGKTLEVEGTIKTVTPVKGGINLELNTGEEMETITGTIDSSQLIERQLLSVGRNALLKGRCAGYMEEEMLGLKNVSLVQCSVVLR